MTKPNQQRGQGLVEYIALTALVAIVSIGTIKVLGSKVKTRLNQITNTFDRNIQQGLRGQADYPQTGERDSGLPGGFRFPKGLKFPRSIPLPTSSLDHEG